MKLTNKLYWVLWFIALVMFPYFHHNDTSFILKQNPVPNSQSIGQVLSFLPIVVWGLGFSEVSVWKSILVDKNF